MSIKTLCTNRNLNIIKLNTSNLLFLNNYSRRSNNNEDSYKVISQKKHKGVASNVFLDPNYNSLIDAKGNPFFLPGNTGPAWHCKYSTVQINEITIKNYIPKNQHGSMTCKIQECPRVLRQTVYELFPNNSLEHVNLSVVTLLMKFDLKSLRCNKELETEKMAQAFVLAAYGICKKLRDVGYWADFINPFSGLPYIQPRKGEFELYATDEKFRCLDFQIYSINDCKMITNEEDKRSPKKFVGSLFTSAPSSKNQLDSIFIDKSS